MESLRSISLDKIDRIHFFEIRYLVFYGSLFKPGH
jgi:hypothetical protein